MMSKVIIYFDAFCCIREFRALVQSIGEKKHLPVESFGMRKIQREDGILWTENPRDTPHTSSQYSTFLCADQIYNVGP